MTNMITFGFILLGLAVVVGAEQVATACPGKPWETLGTGRCTVRIPEAVMDKELYCKSLHPSAVYRNNPDRCSLSLGSYRQSRDFGVGGGGGLPPPPPPPPPTPPPGR